MPGKNHIAADTMSCYPCESALDDQPSELEEELHMAAESTLNRLQTIT